MPQATREIKRRIRSIKSTRQITKAMELVSAAKMRKAVANVLSTRTYAELGWQLLVELTSRTKDSKHPLLKKTDQTKKIGLVVVTSNRGLCGGFNHQLTNKVHQYLATHKKQSVDLEADLIAVGKRGRDIMFRRGHTIVAEFVKDDVTTRLEEITPIAQMIISDYLSGKYDKIVMAYTDFISPISQKPRLKQLLPIEIDSSDAYLGQAKAEGVKQPGSVKEKSVFEYEYLFEPSPDQVLNQLMPRLLEVQLYQALLESDASEHSARMMAMRNASDAAKDMIDDLTLAFNQARQAAITAELADITGGRVAIAG
ncbi:MAG: ATP synthase F1 subunit gamma [Patescibacteria group bacterium]